MSTPCTTPTSPPHTNHPGSSRRPTFFGMSWPAPALTSPPPSPSRKSGRTATTSPACGLSTKPSPSAPTRTGTSHWSPPPGSHLPCEPGGGDQCEVPVLVGALGDGFVLSPQAGDVVAVRPLFLDGEGGGLVSAGAGQDMPKNVGRRELPGWFV